MSVYTRVERGELIEFLRDYPLGELTDFTGIKDGIENTNYFVSTERGRFVLTLFETMGAHELPYFLDLMAFLAKHQVPCPEPIKCHRGRYLRSLRGKPAALVRKLEGANVQSPNSAQCAAVGAALGHLHRTGLGFTGRRDNCRGPVWWNSTAQRVLTQLVEEDAALLHQELRFQSLHRVDHLPRGVIHADLFRDNVLFLGDRLTGIIDFYYACNDVLLYDVAITVNDWCSEPDGSLNNACLKNLLSAYQTQRSLESHERPDWPVMLRAAALRFWLSRLQDMHFPRSGEITHIKNPEVFKRILLDRQRADHAWAL